MTTATPPAPAKVWTEADLLAMPDDGVERWLVNGRLRERPSEFPEAGCFVRNRAGAAVLTRLGASVLEWVRSRPGPRGAVYASRVGVVLRRDPDTVMSADLVYAAPELVAAQDDDRTTLLDGVPGLAVVVLAPNDVVGLVDEKIDAYQAAGVPVVWVVHPTRRTVTVHRPGREPELFNVTHHLPADPALPGFAPPVRDLFE
jgi:Uma2 family endonuclease